MKFIGISLYRKRKRENTVQIEEEVLVEHSDKIEVSYLPQYIPKGFEVIGEEQIFLEKVSLITFFILCISVKRMKEVIFMWKKVLYFLTWILSIMQL